MKAIRPHSAGVSFGLFFAIFHTVWIVLVFTGVAQALLNFVLRLHMIVPIYQVSAFNWTNALGLLAFTAVYGYATGFLLASIWNRFVVHAPYVHAKALTTQRA